MHPEEDFSMAESTEREFDLGNALTFITDTSFVQGNGYKEVLEIGSFVMNRIVPVIGESVSPEEPSQTIKRVILEQNPQLQKIDISDLDTSSSKSIDAWISKQKKEFGDKIHLMIPD